MKFHAYLFVDGSSAHGDDIGAWAAVACRGQERQLLYGIDFPTTISRCELRPVVEGLRWIKANWCDCAGFRVCVYSDSEYTVKTLAGAYEHRSKNKELWAAVVEASTDMQVTYRWRERNSLPYMSFCDGLCGPLRWRQIDFMKAVARDHLNPELDMPFFPIDNLESSDHDKDKDKD